MGFGLLMVTSKGKEVPTAYLFINGTKQFSHNLQHGDTVAFSNPQAQAKYYAISNFLDEAFGASFSSGDLSGCI
ncbi:hypothetical protein [Trichormus azollae]|uniref:hypothetical protein n=1 Tax=Trichormus azollae TaxID=1164 RepID=UPI003D355AFE